MALANDWRPNQGPGYTWGMRKVEHIEQQIGELTRDEFAELREWVLERDWSAWDAQIEMDSSTGKLDKLIEASQVEFKSGRTRGM